MIPRSSFPPCPGGTRTVLVMLFQPGRTMSQQSQGDSVFRPLGEYAREDHLLAPYAVHTRDSRGRRHAEAPHSYRSVYQRDRDRIIHSTAFRRLAHKTQVLVTQINDHHRTRLTHTLEVAQISRTIARQLGLNEDLTEAVAL